MPTATSNYGLNQVPCRVAVVALGYVILICLLLIAQSAHGQTTINLSRDLTTLGIASQNMTPNQPSLDSGPLLRAAVDYAKTRGVTMITVDRGSYYFLTLDSTGGGTFHTVIREFNDATIDFAGSDLYFRHNQTSGIFIRDSTNLTITNFSADYIDPPFTQVRVNAVDPATRTIAYQLIGTWPSPQAYNDVHNTVGNTEEVLVYFFRGTERVQGFGYRVHALRPIAAGTFQIEETNSATALSRIQAGDTALITLRGGVSGILRSIRCTNLTISRVRVYSAGGIAVLDVNGTRNTFERVYVMPRPGTDRLISSNADGLSLQDPLRGNVIRLSRAIRTGDDGFSPHSSLFGYISQQQSARVLQLPRMASQPLPNGTHLIFQDADTGRVVADANLVAQVPAYLVTTPTNTVTTITVDRDLTNLPARTAVYTDDATYRGDGLILERSLVQDMVFARGITLWGLVNATARGNYLKRTSMGAFALFHRLRLLGGGLAGSGDFEGPPLVNTLVRNNVIDQSNLTYGISAENKLAGIFAQSLVADPSGGIRHMTIGMPNIGIQIENNYIAEPQRSAVRMSNVTGGTVRNNLFVRPNNDPRRDALWGWSFDTTPPADVEFRQPVVVNYSAQVDVSGNQLEPATLNAIVTDVGGIEPVAIAPGSAVVLRVQAPINIAANATATLTDADGAVWPMAISGSTASTVSMTLPQGAALGGAYISVRSQSIIIRGTLFVDTDVSDQSQSGAGRTSLSFALAGTQATGRLLDAQGNGIGAAAINVSVEHLTGPGPLSTFTFSGTVPQNVTNGRLHVCINSCGRTGAANVDLHSARYSDSGGQTTLDFTSGLTGWTGTLTPRLVPDSGGQFASFATTISQSGFLNSRTVTMTPGSAYTLTITARVSPSSAGSGYFALLFGTPEVSRTTIDFTSTTSLGTVQTASDGSFMVSPGQLFGAAELVASYAGRQASWAQQARIPLPFTAIGNVFSTAQPSSQSFLRFYNTSSADGSVIVIIRDAATGQQNGQWTSPNIPAGAEHQFSISTLEGGLSGGTAKPAYYNLAVRPTFRGYFQHVLWRSTDGTLTNLSTCPGGVTVSPTELSGVHSSLLDNGYPSSIVINNTGAAPASVAVGIFDARDGAKLGTYSTPLIPAGGHIFTTVASLESALNISPTGGMFHYVLRTEGPFTGFLQHLVNNQRASVTTDMTSACTMTDTGISSSSLGPLKAGAIFSTAQQSLQSFLRIHNTGAGAGTVTVALRDYTSGQTLGQWTSPSIAVGASRQFSIDEIEKGTGATFTKPSTYSISIQPSMAGYVQHVLYRPADGTLTNASTCDAGVTANATQLINVHSTILDFGFPSTVVVTNTGSAASSVTLGVYDSTNGAKLGTYPTASIPANGQLNLPIATIETGAKVSPGSTIYHYNIKAEGAFTGFLQHLVTNKQAGVITDMTTVCRLN